MQGDFNEELEIVDIEYSVLEEVMDKEEELELETSEVNLNNLYSEPGSVELSDNQLLGRDDSDFFKLSDEDLHDDLELEELSEVDLYLNPKESKPKTIDKEKLVAMTAETISLTAEYMNQVIKSLYSVTDLNRVNFEDMTEVKNYVRSIDNKIPFFVSDVVKNETFGYMQRRMDPEEIFYTSSLSDIDKNNEAKKILFIEWINRLYEEQDSFRKSNEHSAYINKKSKEVLLNKMFSGINITERFSSLIASKERNVYTDFYTDGSKITHFKCNNCSTEDNPHLVELQDDLIIISNVNGQAGFIITPSVCDVCGAFHILNPKTFKSISSKCRAIGSKLTAGSKGSNGLKVATYIPSAIEVSNLLSIYHDVHFLPGIDGSSIDEFSDYSVDKPKIIDYDWEAMCQDFRDLNVMIGESKFRLMSPEGSLNNVTKLVANQLNIYPKLKENALASLILTLEKEGMYNFSLASKSYYRVYSKIGDISKITPTAMKNLSEIFTYNLVNEDGTIDYKLATEVFNNMKTNYVNLESDKKLFLANINKFRYLLSFVPISSVDLREDMVYNYLSDPEIKYMLDTISDLMILNHLSEELFNTLSVPESKNVKSKMTYNKKFHNLKKNILSVNRKKPLITYIDMLSSIYFGVNAKSVVNLVTNGDSMNNLSEFLEACYKGDVYDMHKYYKNIKVWDASNCEDSVKELFEFISFFPAEKIDCDKFSFYFDFECDMSYRSRFVKLFENRGFIPKELKGDTLDEKLEYYSKCSSYDAKDIVPSSLAKMLDNYKYVIAFGRFLSYSGMYSDFGAYYGMRDILYQVQYYGVENILFPLSLDSTIASLLIEEDYEYPTIDNSIVRDYIYLTLPVFDPDLEDIQNDITKSYRERINSVIGDVEGLISEYKDLGGLNDLVRELMEDLSERKEGM